MHQARTQRQNQAIRRTTRARKKIATFSLTMLSLITLATLIGLKLFTVAERPVFRIAQPAQANLPLVPSVSASRGFQSSQSGDTSRPLVGIVAGHKGYDPGAVCDDGLTEAEINYAIAIETVELLKRRGVQADLLNEYDPLLTDYQADALVSVHADSCNVPGATGFKVARVTSSAIPEAEDRLVDCLYQEYGLYTGLSQHPASITDNMTNYHAFSEIAPLTPGAIIETGFMLDDRYLLQYKPKIVARGIAAGILCFLETPPGP
jgi:N-acetylmuramoyl-L-alanine amidase